MFLVHGVALDLDVVRRIDTSPLLAALQPILAEKGYKLAPLDGGISIRHVILKCSTGVFSTITL